MTRLAEQQTRFAAALLDPALPLPIGIVGPDKEPSLRRFSVYRNNVVVGLTSLLQDTFPAVQRLVGAEFFLAMAGAYVRQDPPRSPILLAYGGGFAAFIEKFEPAAGLPYLADIARLEWAWMQAYHARDAFGLVAEAFGDIPDKELPFLRLRLHPALHVIRSSMPVLTIWRMNVADGVPGPVELENNSEDVLIVRPMAAVEVRSIPPGGAEFLASLAEGRTVADAAECASACDRRFDLAANIAGLIDAAAFVGFDVNDDAMPRAEEIANER
jgi:hypothetical protein